MQSTATVHAFKTVIHDGRSPEEALSLMVARDGVKPLGFVR